MALGGVVRGPTVSFVGKGRSALGFVVVIRVSSNRPPTKVKPTVFCCGAAVAAPDAYQTRAILALARRLNPDVEVVVRTHSDEERAFLESHGAAHALVGERELAVGLTRHALQRFGAAHEMEAVAACTMGAPEQSAMR